MHIWDLPPLSEAEQVEYFELAHARSIEAEQRIGVSVVHLDLADTVVELRFASLVLERQFLPALSHLLTEVNRKADVVFHLWDSTTSQVKLPPPPVKGDVFTSRGDIWRMNSNRIRSAFHWSEFSLNLFDAERRIGIFCVGNPDKLPYWTKASPLRSLIHWWMLENDCHLLHGAAIGNDSGAVLVTGKGGVGKSTTSLACLASGMRYIGDDYLIVRLGEHPRVFSLYSTAKLDIRQAERFPSLAALVVNKESGDEKAVLQLYPALADQIVRSLPLQAVVTPAFGSSASTEFTSVNATDIREAAAYTTMSQLPHSGRKSYLFMERLVRELPTSRMLLGSNVPEVPGAILRLLADPAAIALAELPDILPAHPLVSVVIPVHNGAEFLAEAVNSILRQQYPALEIIVVDDGSTDNLESAIAALPCAVRYLHQQNAGPSSARNKGIREAAGDYIAFLDVDDFWPEARLHRMVELLEASPGVDVVHGYAQLMRQDSATGELAFIGNPAESFPYYIGAGVYRRGVFERVGLFDSTMRFSEDTDWYKRAEEAAVGIVRMDEVTLHVRRHTENMTLGKTVQELQLLHVFKRALDRKRAQQVESNEAVAARMPAVE